MPDNPDLTYGEMLQAWYNTPTGPSPINTSAAADLIGMDNNRFYYAAMVLYGDPAVAIQIP